MLLWQIQAHHISAKKLEVQASIATHAIRLEQQLKQGMAVNELLAVLLRNGHGALDNFASIADGLLSVSPGLSHLNLAPGGIIKQVYPLAGNEESLDFNLLEDPLQKEVALQSIEIKKQLVSDQVNLVQGGLGFVLRMPIFLDSEDGKADTFWGISNVVIRIESIFESSGFNLLSQQGINYHFFHEPLDSEPKLIYASQKALLSDTVQHELSLPNGRWLLVASPAKTWLNPVNLVLQSLPVLIVSLLVGLLTAQVQRTQNINNRLEKTVMRRTAELQIAAIAFQSQNGILVTDSNLRILKVNKAFHDITGYSDSEAIGSTPALLKSGRHGPAFYKELYARLNQNDCWQGEIWNRRKSGEIYPEHLTITAIRDTTGKLINYVASLVDLTELKATQEHVYQLKYFDTLTSLPNRNRLREALLEVVYGTSGDNQQICGCLLFIDLDHFKQFNDALGQSAGNELLCDLAQRLDETLPPEATLTRLGSDEFVVLLQQADFNKDKAATTAEKLAELLISRITEPFVLANQSHRITASIGVTLINLQGDPDDLLKQAELAMFQAKSKGRNRIYFYEHTMQLHAIKRLQLQADMYYALQKHEFELHYQPQFDELSRIKGVEALIRWHHPTKGNISPGEFIPLAEETDLILKIGEWVLETAFNQCLLWSMNPLTRNIIMSVNVSARQFARADFVQQVEQILILSGANPQRIQLELTESMLVNDTQDIINKMKKLKQLGLLISLDDFGTGYSSLSYVQKLPLDQLKVDQSFIRDINPDDPQRSLAATIVALGLSLDLEVIAEGIETPEQMAFLKERGCHLYQGFLLGKPMTLEALEVQILT